MPNSDYLCKECMYFMYDVLGNPICKASKDFKPTWSYSPACAKFKSS